MDLMEKLGKKEIRELLVKGWMTHDAMWFYHCMQECGMETTNKINRHAVQTMSMIEAKRILKAMGKSEVRTFEDLRELFNDGLSILKGDFMDFTWDFPEKNVFIWEIHGCFAYEGIKKIGAIEHYECGIVERAFGWLQALGIQYECSPRSGQCMMHEKGSCRWEFRFHFE